MTTTTTTPAATVVAPVAKRSWKEWRTAQLSRLPKLSLPTLRMPSVEMSVAAAMLILILTVGGVAVGNLMAYDSFLGRVEARHDAAQKRFEESGIVSRVYNAGANAVTSVKNADGYVRSSVFGE